MAEEEAPGGTLSVSYVLGDIVAGDSMFRCNLSIAGQKEEILAHKFSNREEAEMCIKRLDELNLRCPYFARGKFTCTDPKGSGIAFIDLPLEKWTPFEKWLDKEHKHFYRYGTNPYDGTNECRGFGKTFQIVFEQVALAMDAMHKFGIVHGNIMSGVFIDEDYNVRLANLVVYGDDRDIIAGLLEDLDYFKLLIERAVLRLPKPVYHFPIRRYNIETLDEGFSDELSLFLSLFTHVKSESFKFFTVDHFYMKARWIYRAFIFWSPIKMEAFIATIDEYMEYNQSILAQTVFLEKFKDWRDAVSSFGATNNSNLEKFASYKYVSYQLNILSKENSMYSAQLGIIRFAYNAYNYPSLDAIRSDSLEKVFSLFPHFLGTLYYDIVTYLESQCYNKSQGPQKYMGKLFSDILWGYPTVFELDDYMTKKKSIGCSGIGSWSKDNRKNRKYNGKNIVPSADSI